MGKLGLGDSLHVAALKIADGNVGCASALSELIKVETATDPDSALGSFGALFAFDDMGMEAPNIWVLFSDVCDRDAKKVLLLLRAKQLGFITREYIQSIATRPTPKDIEQPRWHTLLTQVQSIVPKFGKNIVL